MRAPCPTASLVLLLACSRAQAPAPPAVAPVPIDMSDGAGPEGQVTEPPAESPAESPPTAPPLAAPGPVVLAPDAGLRVIHDGRGWDFAATPGRLVVLAEDFAHLEARDKELARGLLLGP